METLISSLDPLRCIRPSNIVDDATPLAPSSSSSAKSPATKWPIPPSRHLASVSKSQRSYALIWVNPGKKRSTSIDSKGLTNPTWNHKFSFRVDHDFLGSDDSAVNVEIYSVSWFRDVLVGTVRINVKHLLAPPTPSISQEGNKNERFMALQIRRPSGDPQGMLNMGVALFNSASRSKPVYSEVSGTSSDCRDLLEKKMMKFFPDSETAGEFPAKRGSVCNGSAVNGGSEPPKGACGESLILGELTAEEAAAKGMTQQPGVKKKGRLVSCFGNAYGFEVTIVCGKSKKQKKD
nr:serine/threonine-protein kinase DDB_G0283821-like [Ipomoea batatas]